MTARVQRAWSRVGRAGAHSMFGHTVDCEWRETGPEAQNLTHSGLRTNMHGGVQPTFSLPSVPID